LGDDNIKIVNTHLVIVGSADEDDRAMFRDMKGATGTYLSKEDLGYDTPKEYGSIIGYMGGGFRLFHGRNIAQDRFVNKTKHYDVITRVIMIGLCYM
jgi:hypothetical protein